MASVPQQIQDNWKAFQDDPATKAALARLDKATFEQEVYRCSEFLTAYYNFESYKTSLQRFKTRRSKLDPATEALFVERFSNAIDAYQSFVSSASNIARLFTESGFERVFADNAPKLFLHLPFNPLYPGLTEMVRTMGLAESDISQSVAHLRSNQWDIFHLFGGDGTFSGLVKIASEQIPTFQNMLSAVKRDGLPVIEGDSGVATSIGVGGGILLGAGIGCVALGWCAFLV
jgi:hypothetical protein